jgi:hypothetical protein
MPPDITPAMLGAIGLATAAIWKIADQYQNTAPSMKELRSADRNSTEHRQALMDTDVLTGVLVIGAGGLAWALTGSPVPLAIVASTYVVVCGYHHLVLRGPSPSQIETGA